MSTEIYYFSGTGNSLYVARELQKLLGKADLIPIAQVLKEEEVKTRAGRVGFVFPCHGLTIPIPVQELLKKLNAESSDYFFAVVTRGGTVFRGFPIVNKLLKNQGKQLNAAFLIDMCASDPKLKSFTVPTKMELKQTELNVQQKLHVIKEIIISQKSYKDVDRGITFFKFALVNYVPERLIPFMVHHVSKRVKKYFYADSKCTGCGNCEKVCPSQKIKINNLKPSWQSSVDCYMCYACLNFCPKEAVQIYSKIWMKSYTTQNGRYPHPYATVKDIFSQKGREVTVND